MAQLSAEITSPSVELELKADSNDSAVHAQFMNSEEASGVLHWRNKYWNLVKTLKVKDAQIHALQAQNLTHEIHIRKLTTVNPRGPLDVVPQLQPDEGGSVL